MEVRLVKMDIMRYSILVVNGPVRTKEIPANIILSYLEMVKAFKNK